MAAVLTVWLAIFLLTGPESTGLASAFPYGIAHTIEEVEDHIMPYLFMIMAPGLITMTVSGLLFFCTTERKKMRIRMLHRRYAIVCAPLFVMTAVLGIWSLITGVLENVSSSNSNDLVGLCLGMLTLLGLIVMAGSGSILFFRRNA
jgi:hypothetical protein